jgi:hypothetical protein
MCVLKYCNYDSVYLNKRKKERKTKIKQSYGSKLQLCNYLQVDYCEEMNSNEEEKNKKKPETMIYYTPSKGNMDCNRNAVNEKTQLGTPFGSQH